MPRDEQISAGNQILKKYLYDKDLVMDKNTESIPELQFSNYQISY